MGGDCSQLNHNQFVGLGVDAFIKHFIKTLNLDPNREEELTTLNNDIFLEIAGEEVEVFPKMLDLIKELDKRNVPMGIASGSSQGVLDLISKQNGLDKYITNIFSSELVENGKPSPDVYLYAASKLGIDPKECLVLEDSEAGVKSAIRAGMQVVWFDFLSSKNEELKSQVFSYYKDGQDSFKSKDILYMFQ
ncbi:MAG: hypothetical protein B6229_04620 [Spirochaetaceae bacterium 4572_7]|nr:MAG: hypothetical protein B6229_04620 [Spirochaetaceae bacterium 4572_7]